MLTQEEVILAQLVLGGAGGIAFKVIGKAQKVTDVFLLGGLTIIFELDKLRELCDGGIGIVKHKAGSVPVNAG